MKPNVSVGEVTDRLDIWAFIAYFFIGSFLVLGVFELRNYGLSWDEGLGNVFFGQRYTYFISTLDTKYLDFANTDLAIHERVPDFSLSPFRGAAHEFPPFIDTLSASLMELSAYRLQWLDPVDGFHLLTVLLSTVLLLVVFAFVANRLGTFAGFLSILMLGAFPRVWADMHFNVKDIPQMVFFSLTIIVYWNWYVRTSYTRSILVGLLFGMALSTKANALFIPAVVILGVWPWQWTYRPFSLVVKHVKECWRHYLVMGSTAILTYIVLWWPFWYGNPVRILQYYQYIFSQGGRQVELSWNTDPLVQAVTTMPEAILAFLVIGIFMALQNCRNDSLIPVRLLLVWLIFPILRSSLPGVVNFDGIRHFQEFVPAACILGTYGAISVFHFANKREKTQKIWISLIILGVLSLNLGIIHFRYYPFQHTYYNSIVGGLAGAHDRFPEATDYWGTSYRHGMHWLSENNEGGAFLYTSIADHLVMIAAPLYLNEDIVPVDRHFFIDRDEIEKPLYVMFVTRKSWYDPLARYCDSNLTPVHQIVVDDVPILKIYRLYDIPEIENFP
jgi:hypothetical protein